MPESADSSTILFKLNALHSHLRNCREDIRALLVDEFSDLSVRELRVPIFAMICDAIYSAAQTFHDKDDFNFYLWPGYNSLVPDENGSHRTDLRISLDLLNGAETPDSIECGLSPTYWLDNIATNDLRNERKQLLNTRREYLKTQTSPALLEKIVPKVFDRESERKPVVKAGFGIMHPEESSADGCPFRIMAHPASIGFWAFLTPIPDFQFPLGSTHRWLSQPYGDLKIQQPLDAPDAETETVLESLVFTTESVNQSIDPSIPTVPLRNLDACTSLDQYFPQYLKGLLASWPYVLKPDTRVQGMNQESIKLARDRYSAWFQTVFLNQEHGTNVNLPDSLIKTDPEEIFVTRMRLIQSWWRAFETNYPQLAAYLWKKSIYTHWYSLSLDNSVPPEANSGRDASLGSLMLFTDHPLHSTFLRVVRLWSENIFLILREKESQQASKLLGKAELLEAWSHELASELSSIEKKIQPASTSSPFQQWKKKHGIESVEDPPVNIGFPPDLLNAQINHLSSWLQKTGPIPVGATGKPSIANLLGLLCVEQIKYIPRRLFSSASFDSLESLQKTDEEIKICHNWINQAFSFECSATAVLTNPLLDAQNEPGAHRAVVAALRVFVAILQNAAKHAWLARNSVENPFIKVHISIQKLSGSMNWLNITILNSCADPELENTKKVTGTEPTVRAIGAPLEVNNSGFYFSLDRDHVWRSTVLLSSHYSSTTDNQTKPWLSIG